MKLFGKIILGVLLGVFLWTADASASLVSAPYYAVYPYYIAPYYAPYAGYYTVASPAYVTAPVYVRQVVYSVPAPVVYAPVPVVYSAPVAYPVPVPATYYPRVVVSY